MQGIGWRQSKACGNAPRLARTRRFSICSLAFHLKTLALDLQCFTKALFLTKNQSKFHLLTTPEVELLVSALKPDDAAYNLYVGMVTFQPGSGRWISELHSVELQTGR